MRARRSRPRPGGTAGFTLVELLIVLSILAVVTVVGATAYNPSFDRNCLNGAAEQIRAAVSFAQMRAASTGMAARVVFDDGNDRITVEQLAPDASVWNTGVTSLSRGLIDPPGNAPSPHPLRPGVAYRVDLNADPRYGGVDLSSPVFGAGSTLTFDAAGRPSSAGSVRLTRGGRRLVLSVDGYSGAVTVE